MENFDFTQFISFDSNISYDEAKKLVENTFIEDNFSIVEFDNMDEVKKNYYRDYWKKYTFEVQNDNFLCDFVEWENLNEVPESILKVIKKLEEFSYICNSEIVFIICYFAEHMKTKNEVVYIPVNKLVNEFFKMSIHSFECPDNLIIVVK